MKAINLLPCLLLPLIAGKLDVHGAPPPAGSQVVASTNITAYPAGWARPKFRLDAEDAGVVMHYGNGPDHCDELGARDVWIWEYEGKYFMHYDGAGPKGWLVCLATSKNLVDWEKHGAVLDLGKPGSADSATASYGSTYFDGHKWHMFYLGSINASPAPDRVPMGPYLTMKAEAPSPYGPWIKKNLVALPPNSSHTGNASPGQIIRTGDEYRMFFSGCGYIGTARTHDLDAVWQLDKDAILSVANRIENTSVYYQPSDKTWWLFTNHINSGTDAIWVYWTKDLDHWNADDMAVVLDTNNCKWSKNLIGLPSVIKVGERLAICYDGQSDPKDMWHMRRDVGLAWLKLPLVPPVKK